MEKTRALFPAVRMGADPYEVAKGADALMIVTEWPQFRDLDWERVRSLMARPLILDGRNLLNPQQIKALGFEYHSVGRPD
jgi:UDPglucose 6-dehydrogenase